MKLGLICSSGGSSIFKAISMFKKIKIKLYVVTDRKCDVIQKCKSKNILLKKILPNKNFSVNAKIFFKKHKVQKILLLYTKFIGQSIFLNFDTYNIHPSWLPKYKGLNALKKQVLKKEKYIGSTLHKVTKTLDTGEAFIKIRNKYQLSNYKKINYLQRTYLCLVFLFYICNLNFKKKEIDEKKFFEKIKMKKIKFSKKILLC